MSRLRGSRLWRLLIAGTVFPVALTVSARTAPAAWRCGWDEPPTSPIAGGPGKAVRSVGLDQEIFRAVAQVAGRHVEFRPTEASGLREAMAQGRIDVVLGVTRTPEREAYALFSAPYREARQVLCVRATDLDRFRFKTIPDLLDGVRSGGMRIGFNPGGACASPAVAHFFNDPANRPWVFPGRTDADNLAALADGDLDAVVCDQLVAAMLTARRDGRAPWIEHPLALGTVPLRAMFNRATTSGTDVADFNRALTAVQADGDYDRILREYLLPPMLGLALGGRWLFWLDLIGTAAFAVSGVLLAHQGRYNLTGAFILAALPAVGGGVLRDLVVGRHPVAVLRSPLPLLVVVGVVVGGCVALKLFERAPVDWRVSRRREARALEMLGAVFDTVGLAVFTVMGVWVAVDTHCEPLWLWGPLLAVLTGAGGGILRDIVRADAHNVTLKRGFYAEVAVMWGLAFSLFLDWQVRRLGEVLIREGTLIVLLGGIMTRLLIYFRGWPNPFQLGDRRTLPARRLAALAARIRVLAADWPAWFDERTGVTRPRTLAEIEQHHNTAQREISVLATALDELIREPRPRDVMDGVAALRRELDHLAAAEEVLYAIVSEPIPESEAARSLQEAIFASAATLGATAGAADEDARATLLALTADRDGPLAQVRSRFVAAGAGATAADRERALQLTVKFERFVQLLQ
ncbi:MAG TPA: TRIC cation channel family protein, partial [Opitutus sp.]|nr:TRIC cation channel family protein [Opitutus sp.]